jgi:hypothetical protein
MRKALVLILAFFMITEPSHALNIVEKMIYKEVRLGKERVLVNRITDKVEKRSTATGYESVSSKRGWGGIPSEQEMFQAQYERTKSR